MRVMVVGAGAREHALAWRLQKDDEVEEVLVAPGNAGSRAFSRAVDAPSTAALVEVAGAERIDLVVIGPEAPLVEGAADALREAGFAVFGPSKAAAQLEGSKSFSKELMARHGIPTADFRVFHDADEAAAYARSRDTSLVVKADGLAAGKGVVVASDGHEAVSAIDAIMRDRAFGDAGNRVVIEELLTGQEVSYHVICDGERYVPLAPAQDHKRALDGDRGPNTGGMGAYSPPPIVTPDVEARIRSEIVEPTLRGMAEEGMRFTGALFIGLMVDHGAPKVLEYNVRFGDPECQCMMTRLGASAAAMLYAAARGELGELQPVWDAPCSLAVVLAAAGYPGRYEKGKRITGLAEANAVEGVTVFHAGTAREDGSFVTAGGRVLTVTATGATVQECAERAYRAADRIHFEGKQYRRDIGHHAR